MNISNKAKKKNDLQQSEIINKHKFQIKACEQKFFLKITKTLKKVKRQGYDEILNKQKACMKKI